MEDGIKQNEESRAKNVEEDKEKPPRRKNLFRDMDKEQWPILGVLSLANLCSTVTFSCIVPFFPTEARQKELTTSQIGLIIGAFQLVSFLCAPVLGKFIGRLNPFHVFTIGLLVTGSSAMLFGLLMSMPSGRPFFWAALIIRCVKAAGNACYETSSLTIVSQRFQGRVSSVMGILETFNGIGYTAGPLIGSGLYELGGFRLPFFVLGSTMLSAAAVSTVLSVMERRRKRKRREVDPHSAAGQGAPAPDQPQPEFRALRLLRIPDLWLTLSAMVVMQISCFFYDASLAEHLSDLSKSSMYAGLMISIVSICYLFSAPPLGVCIDRWPRHCIPVMICGSLLVSLAVLLMGPSPLFQPLGVPKSLVLIGASFGIMGPAIAALYIPTFQNCMNAARAHGFGDSCPHTCGLISGLLRGSAALGGFLGATFGGVCVSWIGFAWTATLVAGLHLCWSAFQLIILACRTIVGSSNNRIKPTKGAFDKGDTVVYGRKMSQLSWIPGKPSFSGSVTKHDQQLP